MSPILFCVYMDELLQRLKNSGLGCHMGKTSYGFLCYADDLSLFSPSISGLQKLISVCEKFANEYSMMFNAKKTVCLMFGQAPQSDAKQVSLSGACIPWSDKITWVTFLRRAWRKTVT